MHRLPRLTSKPLRMFCLLVFFTLLPLPSYATEISGRVSVEGGGPISGAQVTIDCPNDQKVKNTNKSGLYRISVSASEVECMVRVDGSDEVTFYASGRRTRVNLELRGNHLRRK